MLLECLVAKVVEKTDCREPLEVHRNVIDVKSVVFLMILWAPAKFLLLPYTCDGGIKDAVLTASTEITISCWLCCTIILNNYWMKLSMIS